MPSLCGLCGPLPVLSDVPREEVKSLFELSTQLNDGRLIVQGLFARADTRNTNGRVYPRRLLRREVARFVRQHIAAGTALGELNHPSYSSRYFRVLNLPNISHQVLDIHWRGRELWGTLEVLPTPAGLLLRELYSQGIKLGVSSRGWASVVAQPARQRVLVGDDFQLITFDFVPEPSNAGAFLLPIAARYRQRLPDQAAAVRAAFLGLGSMGMGQLQQLPAPSELSRWLKHTSAAQAAAAAAAATVTSSSSSSSAAAPGAAAATSSSSSSAPGVTAAAAVVQQQQQLEHEQPPWPAAPALQPPPPCASVTHPFWPGGRAAEACSSHCEGACMQPLGGSSGAAGASSSADEPPHPPLTSLPGCDALPADTLLPGGVVLGCHYTVLQEAWLPRDPAGRDFKLHLSLMASKAHLMQQRLERERQQRRPGRQQVASSSAPAPAQQPQMQQQVQQQPQPPEPGGKHAIQAA